jgi:UDP-3-O-[3-hydroxymyristoyl] glucosamine N-acyltransferase
MTAAKISEKASIGKDVTIMEGAIIEDDVVIGDGSYIDYRVILRKNVVLGRNSFVGADSILGEFLGDFFGDKVNKKHTLCIGDHAVIRSGAIVYGDTKVGDGFQTGHRVTIREKSEIGNHVSIGTLSDIQGDCRIGDYVHLHSNVHLGQKTVLHNFVWIFPYVITTNDPAPPSDILHGVEAFEYAVVCTGSVILPGKKIGRDALVGAGAVVTKDVPDGMAALGNPAKIICPVTDIKAEGKEHYPWRDFFSRGMPWSGNGSAQ